MDWRTLAKQPVGGREWKETIKRFSGDPALSAQYLPVARAVLGGLIQQLRLGGIEQGHRIVNLPDGSKIRVLHNSGINVVEIVTFPTFLEESGGLTSGGFIFYPKTDSLERGIYPPNSQHAGIPLQEKIGVIEYKPFSVLTYKHNEKENNFLTVPNAPTRIQSGNQFFSDDSGTCYSWWHSNKGDGPLTNAAQGNIQTNAPYRVYFYKANCYIETPIGLIYKVGQYLYKNGNVFAVLDSSLGFIAGIWAGLVTINKDQDDERVEYRYSVVTVNNQIFNLSVFINSGDSNIPLQIVGDTKQIYEGGEFNDNKYMWPVRFNKDGTRCAFLDNAFILNTEKTFYIDTITAIECTITHIDDDFTVTTQEVGYWEGAPLVVTTRTTNDPEVSYNEYGSVTFAEIHYEQKKSYGDSSLNIEYPIALNYNNEGTDIIYFNVEEDYSESIWTLEAEYIETKTYSTGYYSQSEPKILASGDLYFKETRKGKDGVTKLLNFKVGDLVVKQVNVIYAGSLEQDDSFITNRNFVLDTWFIRVVSSYFKDDTKNKRITYDESNFSIGFIDVRNKAIYYYLRYNIDEFNWDYGAENTGYSATSYSIIDFKWYGGYQYEIIINNESQESQTVETPKNIRYENTTNSGATSPVVPPPLGSSYSYLSYTPISTTKEDIVSNRLAGILAFYAVAMGNPPPQAPSGTKKSKYAYSFVIDPRDYPGFGAVWVYNIDIFGYIRVYNNEGVSAGDFNTTYNYYPITINIMKCNIRPSSPLVYTLDDTGNITDQPINDPTLTVYPIGLY